MTSKSSDVVVAGLGGSGAMAAVAAAESGALVIVVERTDDGGGITRDPVGNIRTFADVELAIEHYAHVSYGSTSLDVIRAMVETAVTLPDWFASHGGQTRGRNGVSLIRDVRGAFEKD